MKRSLMMVSLAQAKLRPPTPHNNEVEDRLNKATNDNLADGATTQNIVVQQNCQRQQVDEFPGSENDGTNFPIVNYPEQSEGEFDEDCDDSIEDPNYNPLISSKYDTDSDIEMMGKELESNLASDSESHNYQHDNLTNVANNAESSASVINSVGRKMSAKKQLKKIQAARNKGQSYLNTKGEKVNARVCIALSMCRKKCCLNISYEQQCIIFNTYWELGSYNLRLAFVSGLIEIREKKTQTLQKNAVAPRRRDHTTYYFFEIETKRMNVCQKCFKLTLSETDGFLKTAIAKKLNSSVSSITPDKRGKGAAINKITDEKIRDIHDHINSFPAYESHYTRRDTAKKYLQSDLTISKMYELYCSNREKPVSISKYSEIFKTMNLKFKSPKTDTCNKCEILAVKINVADQEEKRKLLMEQTEHHQDADIAFKTKENDKILATTCPEAKVFTFDLQQCLPTPYLRTSLSFYKRQLWTFNLTVHDCSTNEAHCYMWHEAIAQRGGNEIASCIYRHLESVSLTTKFIVFYSDNCSGQNKNSFVATMFYLFMQNINESSLELIDHKFMVSGHSHMECDSDHSVIERKKKKTTIKIHEPRDWYQFIRSVGTGNRFLVHEMNQDDILNFSLIAKTKLMWRKVDENGQKFLWNEVKWLRFTKDSGSIQFKTTLSDNEPFRILNIRRRGFNNIPSSELQKCYSAPLKINSAKKRDLMDLLPLIDRRVHPFYEALQTEDMPDTHPDLTEKDDIEDQ